MLRRITNEKEYAAAIKHLEEFCSKTGVDQEQFTNIIHLYNESLKYSQQTGIPLKFEPHINHPLYKRTALISDIHGNLNALHAVLEDIELRNCDRIICLGDLVDGGEYDDEVVAKLDELDIVSIQGNHDEFPPNNLLGETHTYLRQLSPKIIEGDIVFTHISPRERETPIRTPIEAWNVFEETDWKITFIGHLHFPVLFGDKGSSTCNAKTYQFEYNTPFKLDSDDRYILSPGPVGYSRDEVQKIRYGIFDAKQYTFEIRTVDGPLLAFG